MKAGVYEVVDLHSVGGGTKAVPGRGGARGHVEVAAVAGAEEK